MTVHNNEKFICTKWISTDEISNDRILLRILHWSTQPGHPSMGRCNEYQPKDGESVMLCGWEVKAGMVCDMFILIRAVVMLTDRVCVEAALPQEVVFWLDCAVCRDDCETLRRHLHVESLSFWAPANIGPYSQAVSVSLLHIHRMSLNVIVLLSCSSYVVDEVHLQLSMTKSPF